MRLSDAGLRGRQKKLIYPDHRLPPSSTEDTLRDRSNRLLDAAQVRLILGTNIVVNRDTSTTPVQAIVPISAGARNPVMATGLQFEVISFEAIPLEASKSLATIVKRFSCLGEIDAADSSLALKTGRF